MAWTIITRQLAHLHRPHLPEKNPEKCVNFHIYPGNKRRCNGVFLVLGRVQFNDLFKQNLESNKPKKKKK